MLRKVNEQGKEKMQELTTDSNRLRCSLGERKIAATQVQETPVIYKVIVGGCPEGETEKNLNERDYLGKLPVWNKDQISLMVDPDDTPKRKL